MMEVKCQYSLLLSLESAHYSFCYCCFQVRCIESCACASNRPSLEYSGVNADVVSPFMEHTILMLETDI